MMKVLVTGSGGFIGQNMARYLSEHGMEVIGVYHNRMPEYRTYKMFSCDLSKDRIQDYTENEKIDAIVHFAGQMRGNEVRDYLDHTVGSTRNLLDFAEDAKVPCFIYISSISVYGETLSEVNEESDRINLDDYGMTKYLCERLLEDARIEKRIAVRLPRTLGKGCDLSYPWLPKVAGQMMNQEQVFYSNPDLLYNNMLYADDLCEFLYGLLGMNFTGFERFVLGADGKMRIIDILELLKQNLSSSSQLTEKPAGGRNKCYAIETSHAQEFGFHSRSIKEIIEAFAGDLKNQERVEKQNADQ